MKVMIIKSLAVTHKTREYHQVQAASLFEQFRQQNSLGEWLRRLCGVTGQLIYLPDVLTGYAITYREVEGSRQVAIAQIRGSLNGRIRDFTADFRPRQTHTQARWINIASARTSGKSLPLVQLALIVGVESLKGTYFVEDGHHRISVARALGDQHINARIVTIHVRPNNTPSV